MSRTVSRAGTRDYAAAHPSRRLKHLRPGPVAVLRRRWRFLLKRLQSQPAIQGPSGQIEHRVHAEITPAVPPIAGASTPVLCSVALDEASPSPKRTEVVKAAFDAKHPEMLTSAQRLQLAREPKPDRRRVQQAIAGAKAELVLSRMGIRLKGTIKARQAREDALYSNVGATPTHRPRPTPPPSQDQES